MSDLVKRDTDGWADVLPAVGDLAGKIAQTEFVPDALRGKPAAIAAAILYGRELGLEPMTALRSISVIKGKPTLSAEAMRSMVLAAGHDIRFQEMTGARCVIVGRRKGQEDTTTVTFTMDDARKMGVGGAQQYAKMPRQMLAARATAELCRLIFADAIGGLMVDVEVEDDHDPIATVTPMTTAKRKKAPATPAPVDEVTPTPIKADPEPVLDDDIIDAEVIEDAPPAPPKLSEVVTDPVTLIEDQLGGEVIDDKPDGASKVREALAKAQNKAPEDSPITANQLKALQAGFKECGIADRDERLNIARTFAKREGLASASDLTENQASLVIDGLAFAKASDDPADFLRKVIK
jgi:hypothetical protein